MRNHEVVWCSSSCCSSTFLSHSHTQRLSSAMLPASPRNVRLVGENVANTRYGRQQFEKKVSVSRLPSSVLVRYIDPNQEREKSKRSNTFNCFWSHVIRCTSALKHLNCDQCDGNLLDQSITYTFGSSRHLLIYTNNNQPFPSNNNHICFLFTIYINLCFTWPSKFCLLLCILS